MEALGTLNHSFSFLIWQHKQIWCFLSLAPDVHCECKWWASRADASIEPIFRVKMNHCTSCRCLCWGNLFTLRTLTDKIYSWPKKAFRLFQSSIQNKMLHKVYLKVEFYKIWLSLFFHFYSNNSRQFLRLKILYLRIR